MGQSFCLLAYFLWHLLGALSVATGPSDRWRDYPHLAAGTWIVRLTSHAVWESAGKWLLMLWNLVILQKFCVDFSVLPKWFCFFWYVDFEMLGFRMLPFSWRLMVEKSSPRRCVLEPLDSFDMVSTTNPQMFVMPGFLWWFFWDTTLPLERSMCPSEKSLTYTPHTQLRAERLSCSTTYWWAGAWSSRRVASATPEPFWSTTCVAPSTGRGSGKFWRRRQSAPW